MCERVRLCDCVCADDAHESDVHVTRRCTAANFFASADDHVVLTWSLNMHGGHPDATAEPPLGRSGCGTPIVGLAVTATRVVVCTRSYVKVCSVHGDPALFTYYPDVRIESIAVGRVDLAKSAPDWRGRCWARIVRPPGDIAFIGGSLGEVLSLDLTRRESWSELLLTESFDSELSPLERVLTTVMPLKDFYVTLLLMLVQFFQTAAFAFAGPPIPPSFESIQAALHSMQRFRISVPFGAIFGMAVAVCVIFLASFAAQERVELATFLKPQLLHVKYLWLAMSIFSGVLSTVAFIPIIQVVIC